MFQNVRMVHVAGVDQGNHGMLTRQGQGGAIPHAAVHEELESLIVGAGTVQVKMRV